MDNMIKINTFIMAVIKNYCLFHFQTEICYFLRIFHIVNICPPPLKKCILPPSILRTFPMELEYPENIKNSLNGIYYRFSEKYG